MQRSVESVEVTWLNLDVDDATLEEFNRSLSADERDRIALLATPLLKHRASARLGLRRRVLARSLRVDPRDVAFDATPAGKPIVRGAQGSDVAFSASHCGPVGVVAVGARRRIGVDVESLAAPDEARRLARRIVTPQEATAIEGLSGRPLQRAVLRLWTRKEAWAKATGAGLGAGLDRLEVPIGADQWGVRLASTEPWWLFALRGPDFDDLDAALVVSGDKGEGAPTVTVADMHHAARS